MRLLRTLALILALVVGQTILHAQVIVSDPVHTAETVKVLDTARDIVKKYTETLERIGTIAAPLGNMDRFRTPAFGPSRPDAARYPRAPAFVQSLLSGDPRDDLYRQYTRPVPNYDAILARTDLSPIARRVIETAISNLQVYDTVIPRAVHATSQQWGFAALQDALEALGEANTSKRNATHWLGAVLGKVAGGVLIQNRQAANATAIGLHILEQSLARNVARRNDAVAAVNFNLGMVERGQAAAENQIAGSTDAILGWRLR